MHGSSRVKPGRREQPLHRHRQWCCSFVTPPLSPEKSANNVSRSSSSNVKTEIPSNSPQAQHLKLPLSRWILSPGRVSPISDNLVNSHTDSKPLTRSSSLNVPVPPDDSELATFGDESDFGPFDVRMNLKGKNGRSMILDLSSEVLIDNSSLFADLIGESRKNRSGLCKIDVPDVENMNAFRETIELMFEDDIQRKLLNIGVFRAIHILEVSASIKFTRGVSSCLKYLAAVPWVEEEEEKLRELCAKLNLDDILTKEISERIAGISCVDTQQTLIKQLITSITICTDANARTELKSLVKSLLTKSTVYRKDNLSLNKDVVFVVCRSCLDSLTNLLHEALCSDSKTEKEKPLLERISNQVDNINWMLEILLDHQTAEKFVNLWANQKELLELYYNTSPMVRYEVSRITAAIFIGMGTRKLQCQLETRSQLLHSWFRPMLSDFGWLQRCKKGLDMMALEEAMGQMLLTLPLKEQHSLFMDWIRCFSKNGADCPNLGKAFQIWWRRSFAKGLETAAVECR